MADLERPLPGQEVGDARQRILEAAEALFAEHGFEGTSVQEITDAAHINKAMLYYYFENKEHLYGGLIESGLVALGKVLDEVLQKPVSPEEKLQDFLERYGEILCQKERVVRLIYREIGGGIESTRHVIESYFVRNVDKLKQIIEEGIARGCFRPVNAAMTATSIFGMMNIFITTYFLTGQSLHPKAVWQHNLDILLNGVRRCGGTPETGQELALSESPEER